MKRIAALLLVTLAALLVAAAATASSSDGAPGAVYTLTNSPGGNAVAAFSRSADGTLAPQGTFATGGLGTGAGLGSQGALVVSDDHRSLYAVNAGSNTVSAFAVTPNGLELVGTAPSGGTLPISVTVRGTLVYVVNAASRNVTGFVAGARGLTPLAGSSQPLGAGSSGPAQIQFSPDGSTLVVTERATDSIITFAVGRDDRLGEMRVSPSSGPTPYGFAFTSAGTLVVTEAFRAAKGEAAASTHILRDGTLTPVTKSLGNGRSEICWVVVTPDDRYAFTTNFADGAVSRYAIGMDGSLTLEDATAGLTEDGRPGLRDEDLSADGRFLYAIDADAGHIVGWAVAEGGSLAPIGTWGGLPKTIAGLAAR